VAVAAFDPQTERYVTKVTSGVPIRVVDVPRLNPETVDYHALPATASRGWPDRASTRLGTMVGLVLLTQLLAVLLARAALWRWRIDPRWWLVRRARRIAPHPDPAQTAREITDILSCYLELAAGRPRGALTPDEARTAISEASGDADLGVQAAWLVAQCDRACYACADPDPLSVTLVTEARRLFEQIGKKRKT
jgi:hypothetical protein